MMSPVKTLSPVVKAEGLDRGLDMGLEGPLSPRGRQETHNLFLDGLSDALVGGMMQVHVP